MAYKKKKNTKSTKSTKNSSNILTYMVWFLAFVAMGTSALVSGYYFGYEDAKQELSIKAQNEKEKRLEVIQKLEELSAQEKKKQTEISRLQKVLKKESMQKYSSASHEFDDATVVLPPKREPRKKKEIAKKPKLAIIIDDISVRSHIKAIRELKLPITMSFLPPSKRHPNSATLAAKENFYMVHLPMEAQNFSAEEPDTLRITDSQEKISKKIQNLKLLFPRVSFINNHTGSKFTSNELAMSRLIYALKANNISFIDSRTTAQTKAPQVLKKYGLPYVSRDIFLDHEMEKSAIKKQIVKAIEVAKKHGNAIAIGHPHANTLLALHESRKLFDEVELVYINKLY